MATPEIDQSRSVTIKNNLYEILSNKKILIAITLFPAIGLFAFVNLLPIVWSVAAGFFEISPFSPDWAWAGLANYPAVLSDPSFHSAIWKSLIFAASSVIFQLVAGVTIALVLNKSFENSSILRSIVMLPYLLPTAILAFIALWMGNSQYGIINQILSQLGLIGDYVAWYGEPGLAMWSVVLTGSWKWTIFVTIMVLARIQSIPSGFYEAAEISGATPYQKFRDITLPNLKGVIFIVVLLRGIWMFNKFDIIYVLTGGGPVGETTTAPLYAYDVAFGENSLGEAAAISTILFAILIVAAILYFVVLKPSEEVRTS